MNKKADKPQQYWQSKPDNCWLPHQNERKAVAAAEQGKADKRPINSIVN